MDLDHTVIPVEDKEAASQLMVRVMGWEFLGFRGSQGHVRVNDTLVLRFDDKAPEAERRSHHFAFHVGEEEFDAILGRLAVEDLKYGTSPRDMNMQWNELHGGRRIFFADHNGHSYELMTAASPPGLG